MIVSYFGKSFVRLQAGEEVIGIGPTSKKSEVKGSSFGAGIGLVPKNHLDYNGIDSLSYGAKQAFAIDGPGEYEVRGIFIKGMSDATNSEVQREKDAPITTFYTMVFDGMRICYIGGLEDGATLARHKEEIGDIDIAFIPTYGGDSLGVPAAVKAMHVLSPHITVPLFYGGNKASEGLKQFFKESGEDEVKPVAKLTLKKKDTEEHEGSIIPIKSF